MDYTSISGSITFTPTVSQQNISVPIIDDLIREDRETLTVTLTNAPARVMLIPGQGTIGILDNDGKTTHTLVQPISSFCLLQHKDHYSYQSVIVEQML